MKFKRSATPLFLIALALSACSSKQSTQAVAPVTLAGCYTASVGDDRAYLNIAVAGNRVGGTLEYAFAQKDNSWGIVTGPLRDDELILDYQYLSEGLLSTRTLTLKRNGESLSGEGFTFSQTMQCGSGPGWSEARVTDVAADMFHDPETGYYTRTHFKIDGPTEGYRYRCISTVTKVDGSTIAQWVGEGVTGNLNARGKQNMQTNIRPDQVKEVSGGRVACQVKALSSK